MTWLPLQEARKLTGHDTVPGLQQMVYRWNRANPDKQIMRLHGKLDSISLRAAIRHQSYACTNKSAVRAAAASTLITIKKRSRANG